MNPQDQINREKVCKDLNSNIFLKASAGTGKTTLLVNRYLALIDQNIPMDKIVAITFTQKAAHELKERIRMVLIKKGFHEQAKLVFRSNIQTIHSFAKSILTQHAFDLGCPIELMTPAWHNLWFNQTFKQWLDINIQSNPQLYYDAFDLGFHPKKLRQLAYELYHNRSIQHWIKSSNTIEQGRVLQLQKSFDQLYEFSKNVCVDQNDLAWLSIHSHQEQLSCINKLSNTEKYKGILEIKRLNQSRGQQKNYTGKESLSKIKNMIEQYNDELLKLKTSIRSHYLNEWMIELKKYADHAFELKSKNGYFTYDDLIDQCVNILEKNPNVLNILRNKYTYIFVDEFQDTDFMQAKLIWLIATSGTNKNCFENKMENKLFIVGDFKQSIYRFRKASIETYQLASNLIEKNGKELSIYNNFRSNQIILNWVNHVFSKLFKNDYSPIHSSILDVHSKVFRLHQENHTKPTASEQYQLEAKYVASFVKSLIDHQCIHDTKTNTVRKIKPGDIAVIFPNTTGLKHLEKEFKNNRIRTISFELGFESLEISGLIDVIKAAVFPNNPIHVVAALKSIYFALSDKDLFELKTLCSNFDYTQMHVSFPKAHVQKAIDTLKSLHQSIFEKPIEAMSLFINQTLTHYRAYCMDGMKEKIDAIDTFMKQYITFLHDVDPSILAFLQWVDSNESLNTSLDQPVSKSDDAVNFLTIHKSKGLEFEVVVVCMLNVNNTKNPSSIVHHNSQRYEIGFGSKDERFCTDNYENLLEQEKSELQNEKLRLLYVAMTRAKSILAYTDLFEAKSNGFLSMIKPCINNQYESPWNALSEKRPSSQHESNIDVTDMHHRLIEQRQHLQKLYESSQFEDKDSQLPFFIHEAAYFGSAYHYCMQHLNEDVERLCENASFLFSCSDKKQKLIDCVSNTLKSDLFKRIQNALTVYREYPVVLNQHGNIIHAYVDVLFKENDLWFLVDYKTDDSSNIAKHKKQLEFYKSAIESVSSIRIHDMYIYFATEMKTISLL